MKADLNEYISKELKPTRIGFGEALVDVAQNNSNLVGLGADITGSVSMDAFAKTFPERFFSFGIAEQNIVGAAAGLAMAEKIPVLSTYGVFAALRTTDQIRVSVCYNNLKVIIGGAHAGISVGPDGATHQALEDIAIMRVLPNMTVLSPCDAAQTRILTQKAIEECNGPVYIRFGREAVPNFTEADQEIELHKAQVLNEGNDLTIMATGHMVWEALEAAKALREQNISASVLNIHSIKPLDEETIIKYASKTGAVVSAEEHQIIGGLGSAIAECLMKNLPVPMEMVGMNDSFGESGKPEELMNKYGMTAKDIIFAAQKVLERKSK